MASFAKDSERLLELIGTGLSMAEACQRGKIPYGTPKKWVDNGRKAPDSRYGAWLARLTAAKTSPGAALASPVRDAQGPTPNPSSVEGLAPGPVEARVDSLLEGCEPSQQAALAGAQAKALGRRIDQLSFSPGAAAGTAMAHCSRRLEQLVPLLEAPREDDLDRLKARFRARRSGMASNGGPAVSWHSIEEAERLDKPVATTPDASNGAGERGGEW